MEDPLIGTNIGPYRIDSLIGTGGMGRVYLGIHPTIESRVAIKVLAQDCAENQDIISRFFDEARAVNLIRHENIVNILDLDYLPDRRPYIVMEFLDGAPLSQVIGADRALPIGTTLRMIEEVLGALAAAHQKQVVHRDLKPDNIIISPQGRPKVLDFGIAKLSTDHADAQNRTREGSVLGTPHYMSPEQAHGIPVDARADIYAMGIILFECLTSQKPFRGENLFELLRQHIEVPAPSLRSIRPTISVNLERVVLRALDKDPNQRWQHVEEFAEALQREQHGLQPSEWTTLVSGASSSSANHSPSRTPVGLANPTPRMSAPSLPAPVAGAHTSHKRGWVLLAVGLLVIGAGASYLGSRAPAKAQVASNSAEEPPEQALVPVTAPSVAPEATNHAPDAAVQQTPTPATTPTPSAPATPSTAPTPSTPITTPTPSTPPPSTTPKPTPSPPTPRTPTPSTPPTLSTTPTPSVSATNTNEPARSSSETKNPSRFDAYKYLRTATKRAKRAFSDAALMRIDLKGVSPDGKADLTLFDNFSVTYRFFSPSRAKRPSKLPAGVPFSPMCVFYVSVEADVTDNYPLEWDCSKMRPIGRPRCSPRDIWKRAISDGAPRKNAVASLGFRRFGGKRLWYFSIDSFSRSYPDDC